MDSAGSNPSFLFRILLIALLVLTAACSGSGLDTTRDTLVKYDDAEWHYGGDFPEDSPIEFGAVHIGVFVKLAFEAGLAGELHVKEFPEDTALLVNAKITGTDFVMNFLDGKLTREDLNLEGQAFADAYYPEPYFDDFLNYSGIALYSAAESAVNFETMRQVFQTRLAEFRSGRL